MSLQNTAGFQGYPVPIGTIVPFVGNRPFIPDGWLLCNGEDRLISDYPDLYAVLGTNYNANTTPVGYFRTPDLVNHQYILGKAVTDPTIIAGNIAEDIEIPVLTANLPTLSSARFNVTNVGVNANPPPLYGTGGGFGGDEGGAEALIVATDNRYPDIDINHKAGSTVSFTNNLRVDATVTLTAQNTLLEGWLMCYIIKAYNIPPVPPVPPVNIQVPNPTRVYINCPELSGFVIQ